MLLATPLPRYDAVKSPSTSIFMGLTWVSLADNTRNAGCFQGSLRRTGTEVPAVVGFASDGAALLNEATRRQPSQ